MMFQAEYGGCAMTGVTLKTTVGEPCRDLSQVILHNRLAAQLTERLLAMRPAIHQNELHVAPPKATQRQAVDPVGQRATNCSWILVIACLALLSA